jgi:hypothetical protein
MEQFGRSNIISDTRKSPIAIPYIGSKTNRLQNVRCICGSQNRKRSLLRVRVGVTKDWAYITNKTVTCSRSHFSCEKAYDILKDIGFLDPIGGMLWSPLVCVIYCVGYSTPKFRERNKHINFHIRLPKKSSQQDINNM